MYAHRRNCKRIKGIIGKLMKHILLTGGTGMIGSAIIYLRINNYDYYRICSTGNHIILFIPKTVCKNNKKSW